MNHMKEIALLLGVEIGEEFKIEGPSGNVKYRLTEENLEYLSSCDHWFSISSTLNFLLNGEYKVVKIPKPVLDDVEKEYLLHVIKPFRNRIKYFFKFPCANGDYEAIAAVMKGRDYYDSLSFPKFKKGSMYKGMEPNKKYTLDDLGL